MMSWFIWKHFAHGTTIYFHVTTQCVHTKLLQLCSTLCDLMDCSPPGSSVHRILQARIPEWGAMPFSRGSSRFRDCTHFSMAPALASRSFTTTVTWEAQTMLGKIGKNSERMIFINIHSKYSMALYTYICTHIYTHIYTYICLYTHAYRLHLYLFQPLKPATR